MTIKLYNNTIKIKRGVIDESGRHSWNSGFGYYDDFEECIGKLEYTHVNYGDLMLLIAQEMGLADDRELLENYLLMCRKKFSKSCKRYKRKVEGN